MTDLKTSSIIKKVKYILEIRTFYYAKVIVYRFMFTVLKINRKDYILNRMRTNI